MLLPPEGIGDFVVRQTTFLTTTAGQQIVAFDSTRVAIVFGNVTSHAVSLTPQVGTGPGVFISSGGIPWTCSWQEHGALVNQAWYTPNAVAAGFSVIEIFYRPAGR